MNNSATIHQTLAFTAATTRPARSILRRARLAILLGVVSLLGLHAAPSAWSQSAPKYRVAEIVPLPPGFTEQSQVRYIASNAQGYILFEYFADYFAPDARALPLVYKGNGEFVPFPLSGLPANGGTLVSNISDVASDGSFRVIGGIYMDRTRPVIWTVSSNGSVSSQVLTNLVLPPNSQAPGEQPWARALAVNSAGVVVGDGASHLASRGLRWFAPDPTAQIFPESMVYDTAFDIDEAGNYVRRGQTSGTVFYNGTQVTFPAADALASVTAVRGERAIGEYQTGGNSGIPYVYSAATGQVMSLPKYIDPRSPDSATTQPNFLRDLNAAGDITGQGTQNAGAWNRPTQLLWKRQANGTYQFYPLIGMIEDPAATSSLQFDRAEALDITADGRLIADVSFNYQERRAVILQPVLPNPGPPLPATTGFTVNDSSTGIPVPPDSVLRMRVTQPSTAARLIVRVQSSTTPANEGSWTDLNNGSFGRMIFDVTNETYVLNTTTYPRVANVHFRVIASAPSNASSISNVVGPFNLTSSTPHLGRTILSTTRNGIGAKINFRAFDETHPAGTTMRIQSATSPGDESNWADLANGNGGRMAPYRNPGDFYLDSKDYPAHGALYFRAVASAPGFVDSPSRGVGPFLLINSPSPTVRVTSPGLSGAGIGTDFEFPVDLPAGPFNITADAAPAGGPGIKSIGLLYDGATVERFVAASGSRSYTPPAPGDHVVEASAIDDLGVIGDSIPVFVRIAPANGKVFQRLADGDWSDPARWLDRNGNSGVPGANDLAIVGTFNVALSQDVTVLAVGLHGGTIAGPAGLTVTGTLTASKGTISAPRLTITETGALLLVNEEDVAFSGTIINRGRTQLIGRAGITGVRNSSRQAEGAEPDGFFDGVAAFFQNLGDFVMGRRTGGKREARPAPQPVPETPRTVVVETFENAGSLIGQDGAGLIGQDLAGLIGQDGAGIISNDGASIISNDGSSLIGQDGAGILGDSGSGIISGGGGNIISGGAGNFIPGARPAVVGDAPTVASSFTQTGGTTNLNGIRVIGPMILSGGVLKGSGLIAGDLTNTGGFIAPGNSAGSIAVTGNFTQTANGSLLLELGGVNSYRPDFDQLKVGGSAALGGKLSVKTINGFTPNASTSLVPLSYGSASGTFAFLSGNVQFEQRDTGAALSVTGPNPPAPKLLNIATRMRVEAGDNVLIGGFIVTGTAAKKVLLRAIGPSLPLSDKLADPTLELVQPGGATVFNNNWADTQAEEVRGTTIPPSNELESAIVITLQPGAYTAVVRGVGGGTGVALVEVYDLDQAADSTLANISTRGLVQTGENVMIGGVIIGGTTPAKTLIRAIGPSLSNQGVAGALQDPELQLVDRDGNIISNDDWRATQEAEIIATTVPPPNSREAAIVATLVPGAYTAIVRGKNNTTGIALVEVYNLQ